MPAEPERLTYVLTIDCDHLGERTANAAYILTLKVSYDCRPAPQHVMSWHLGQIGREAARVAGAPMTVAYGPADHAYEVAASAEGPVGRGGRSRPIASFGLFRAITDAGKGLTLYCTVSIGLFPYWSPRRQSPTLVELRARYCLLAQTTPSTLFVRST